MDIQYIYTSAFIAHDTYQYVTVLVYMYKYQSVDQLGKVAELVIN